MLNIDQLPADVSEITAHFSAVSTNGQNLLFTGPLSGPRAIQEQVANHLERLKKEANTENIRFLGFTL